MTKNKRKNKLSMATVFFITVSACLVILGVISYFILEGFVFRKPTSKVPSSLEKSAVADKNDSFTMLILGTESGLLKSCELMYYNSLQGSVMFVPISPDTACQVNTKKGVLSDFYNKQNIKLICSAAENIYDIKIQKYIEITPASFNVIITTLGKTSTPPLYDIEYTNPQTGESYSFTKGDTTPFNSNQLINLISYPGYPNKTTDNLYVLGSVSSDIINTFISSDKDILSCMDTLYKDVISVAFTSLSEYDYYSKKNSFLYMLESNKKPAYFILPKWETDTKGQLVLSSEHIDAVRNNILQ